MNLGNFDLPPGLGIIIDYDALNTGNFGIVYGCTPGAAYQDPTGIVEVEAGVSEIEIEAPAVTVEYDHWEVSWDPGVVWNSTSNGHHQFRQIIDASLLSVSGSMVRIKLGGDGVNTYNVDHCTIGERSGSTEDFASTPTRITFDSGNNGCSVPTSGKWSDEIVFAIDETKSYLIHLDMGTGTHPNRGGMAEGYKCYYNLSSGEEFTLDVSMTLQDYTRVVEEVEVWVGDVVINYLAGVSDIAIVAPEAGIELGTAAAGGFFFAQG